jgi:thiol-disulfide isomerase/thioredoxin
VYVSPGLSVLVAVLVAATVFGVWRRLTDGRIRGVTSSDTAAGSEPGAGLQASALTESELGGQLGERATLVQFSTAFCQPCRATRRILAEVAGQVPGVRHVEVDAEAHLDLVRRLDVMRTPTVFVLDSGGRVVRRAVGQPRMADVVAALGEAIP